MIGSSRALRPWLAWVVVGLAALVPFSRGLVGGGSFYFRDLSGQFLPFRLFALEGLQRGELRYWNPLVHEGEPLSLPPVCYPLDLLQLLVPDERGISLALALHVPLAALTFMGLARRLGLSARSAAAGALAYALGGFALSCLNLYIYVQAVAWAPLVVSGLVRAAEGGRRAVVAASVLFALALSTTGVEIVLQSVIFGLVLAARRDAPRRWLPMASSVALGVGLAAVPICVLGGLAPGSARSEGFPTDVVLSHSVHPLTLVQVLIAGFYGDPMDLTTRWWGENFFPQGFPYLLSLYLGAAALALAAVGGRLGAPWKKRVLVLGLAALVIGLGRYAGLSLAVDALPWVRMLRFPTKAFFGVHLAVALLAASGLDALSGNGRAAWRLLALWAFLPGSILVAAPALPRLLPDATRWFASGFFPPDSSAVFQAQSLSLMLQDAAKGGAVALCVGLVAVLVLARRFEPDRAIPALAALVAADLIRAGAALNPMVDISFFRLSGEMSGWVRTFRQEGGRVFTCEPEFSSVFHAARETVPLGRDAWTFAAYEETLAPFHNMMAGVPTALSRDRTMLVPVERTLSPREVACASPSEIAGRLRSAGVAHVLSVAPLEDPELRFRETVGPRRVSPLQIHIYALERPLALRAVARTVRTADSAKEAGSKAEAPGFREEGGVVVEGRFPTTEGVEGRVVSVTEAADRIDMVVEADRPTVAVVRDAYAPGWAATVDGAPIPVLRANGRHRAVAVPAGRSHVTLSYRPPGLALGLALSGASACLALGLWVTGRRRV